MPGICTLVLKQARKLTNMNFKQLLVEGFGPISRLTLNRPDSRNALNSALLLELAAAIDHLDTARVRVLILTGAGNRAFCAGADLKELDGATPEQSDSYVQLGRRIFQKLESLGIPVIAAVNGFAVGGGCELALACDLRTASTRAKFSQPEVNLGNIPAWGGTQRLPRLVGVGRAKEILFTGEMVDAQEAWRIGLVNRLFSPDKLLDGTFQLAEAIAGKAPIALKFAKRAIEFSLDNNLDAGLRYESLAGEICTRTEDQNEGIHAFKEKRIPNFRGK